MLEETDTAQTQPVRVLGRQVARQLNAIELKSIGNYGQEGSDPEGAILTLRTIDHPMCDQ